MEKLKKPKPLKNIDSATRSLCVRILSVSTAPLCLLGFIFGKLLYGNSGALTGIILGVIVCVFLTLITIFISDKLGDFAAIIFKGRNATWSLKEQLEGDLSQVRYHKMKKEFDQALIKVDAVRKYPMMQMHCT